LDYFSDLGVTALWFTPVLENNMAGGSYHGYATTDYYKVDPRFGTNEEYKQLIEKSHARGIKS
jgi:Alpha amylase, catalytic domain